MSRSGLAGASAVKVWRWPAALAGATVLGLGSALLGDGLPWRWLSWLMLAAPLGQVAFRLSRAWWHRTPRQAGVAPATRSQSRGDECE